MIYTLANAEMTVQIGSVGAEIVSVVRDGKERVWQNETGEWSGHGPVLFPVCGNCGVRVNGVSYPIRPHGFAKKSDFALTKKTDDSLTLSLFSSAATKEVYPFDFALHVTYTLEKTTVVIEYRVENPAQTPLYFACGGHESFALDTDRVDEYELVFEKEEQLVHYVHDDETGKLTGETQSYGRTTAFTLPYDFFQNDRTLITKNIRSRKVLLRKKSGEKVAEVAFEGFSNLLLWRSKNAKYICIEPWSNLPDTMGEADVEFPEKAGVFQVDGGSEKTLVRKVKYGD